MKFLLFFSFLVAVTTIVLAWEKEDHEIFDLVGEIEASEGKGTTFYSWLDVPPTASTGEISKAYRKMSVQLHPDKSPGVKGVHERFARLGVIAAILRNKESRKRYDFFYKNGVPRWRGTGYYYSRFRPGLGTVVIFLIIITSGLQLLVQRLNYRRDLERIDRFIREARLSAWGSKLTPLEGQRKVKVYLGGEEGPYSKALDMVVDGSNVYILDPSGNMDLLDSSAATYPLLVNTWFLVMVKVLFHKAAGTDKGKIPEDKQLQEEEETSSTSSESGRSLSQGTRKKLSTAPVVKAGGKRRKTIPKRR